MAKFHEPEAVEPESKAGRANNLPHLGILTRSASQQPTVVVGHWQPLLFRQLVPQTPAGRKPQGPGESLLPLFSPGKSPYNVHVASTCSGKLSA